MKITITCPVTGRSIPLPDGVNCPRIGETVCIAANENYKVIEVTHDYLCAVTWIYLADKCT